MSPCTSFTRFCCFWLFFFGYSISFSQTFNGTFKQVHLGVGLDINCVTDMAEGPEGFRWFTSWTGLYRYDGYEFKKYSVGGKGDKSPNVEFLEIFVDSKNRIWSTSILGTSLYSPSQDTLITFGPPSPQGPHIKYNKLFLEDKEGNIWRSSQHGVQKIHTDTLQNDTFPITHYVSIVGDNHSLPHQMVNSMLQDEEGNIWMGTYGGLCRYDPVSGRFYRHLSFSSTWEIHLKRKISKF